MKNKKLKFVTACTLFFGVTAYSQAGFIIDEDTTPAVPNVTQAQKVDSSVKSTPVTPAPAPQAVSAPAPQAVSAPAPQAVSAPAPQATPVTANTFPQGNPVSPTPVTPKLDNASAQNSVEKKVDDDAKWGVDRANGVGPDETIKPSADFKKPVDKIATKDGESLVRHVIVTGWNKDIPEGKDVIIPEGATLKGVVGMLTPKDYTITYGENINKDFRVQSGASDNWIDGLGLALSHSPYVATISQSGKTIHFTNISVVKESPTLNVNNAELDHFVLHQGESLETQVFKWADRSGNKWTIRWDLDKDWLVAGDTDFGTDFKDAIKSVINILAQNGIDVRADIYDMNKTIVVHSASLTEE